MKDKFRLDLTDKDTTFIWETLHGFSENAAKYGRKLIGMRMAKIMFDRLGLKSRACDPILEGASIVIDDTEFEDTIELRYEWKS